MTCPDCNGHGQTGAGLCQKCRGETEVCPECGAPLRESQSEAGLCAECAEDSKDSTP